MRGSALVSRSVLPVLALLLACSGGGLPVADGVDVVADVLDESSVDIVEFPGTDASGDLPLPRDVPVPDELAVDTSPTDTGGPEDAGQQHDPFPDLSTDEQDQSGDSGCLSDSDCPEGRCDTETGSCVECLLDTDCPVGSRCAGNTCMEWACAPGSRFCDGTWLAQCLDDGSAIVRLYDCISTNPCLEGGGCEERACVAGKPRNCNDGNPCTTDTCDPAEGCIHVHVEAACEDGDPCTVNDRCSDGRCVAGGALTCDDGNPCTSDYCASAVGCVFEPNTLQCSDGNACTFNDRCLEGRCVGIPRDCDDGEPCTLDSCAAGTGQCVNTAIPGCGPCLADQECEDGNPCSVGRCSQGRCTQEPSGIEGCCESAMDCLDSPECTIGVCVAPPFGTCDFVPAPEPACCQPELLRAFFLEGESAFTMDAPVNGVGWRLAPGPSGGTGSFLYYGNATGTSYDNGARNAGQATGPLLTLPAGVALELRFRTWQDVETVPGRDVMTVVALAQTTEHVLWTRPTGFPVRVSTDVVIDLSALAGRTIRLAFRFDTVDELQNSGRGIWVDELVLSSACLPRGCIVPGDCLSLGWHGNCVEGACDFSRVFRTLLAFSGSGIESMIMPTRVALEPDGDRVFIADRTRARILVHDREGRHLNAFGSLGTTAGRLNQPRGMVSSADRLYVADTGNHRIQAFSLSGVQIFSLGRLGNVPGLFNQPKDVTLSPDGDILIVADTGNHRVQTFTINGVLRDSFGSFGRDPGQFRSPSCVASLQDGRILVCDTQNDRVQAFTARGTFLGALASSGSTAVDDPYGMAVALDGFFVSDTNRHRIVRIAHDGSLLDAFGSYGSGLDRFAFPMGLAHDPKTGRLWVADASNARIVVMGWEPVPH